MMYPAYNVMYQMDVSKINVMYQNQCNVSNGHLYRKSSPTEEGDVSYRIEEVIISTWVVFIALLVDSRV
eukprot:SAG11_NODE_3051_length_2727_cov_4.133181_1_plen_69_part_00